MQFPPTTKRHVAGSRIILVTVAMTLWVSLKLCAEPGKEYGRRLRFVFDHVSPF